MGLCSVVVRRRGVKVDADVVEARKARAVDVLHAVVGHEEALLPAHKDGAAVAVGDGVVGLLELGLDVAVGGEAGPVDGVGLLGRAPVLGEEAVARADDLCVKVGRELGPVVGEAADAQVAAEEGRGKVDVLGSIRDDGKGRPGYYAPLW